jgi:hypothetical protein
VDENRMRQQLLTATDPGERVVLLVDVVHQAERRQRRTRRLQTAGLAGAAAVIAAGSAAALTLTPHHTTPEAQKAPAPAQSRTHAPTGLEPGVACDGANSFRVGDTVLADGIREIPYGTVFDLPADGPLQVSLTLGGDRATLGHWTADLWDGHTMRTTPAAGSVSTDGRSGTATVRPTRADGTPLPLGRYYLEVAWEPLGCGRNISENTFFSVRLTR